MRWKPGRGGKWIEDRRGRSGGGGGGLPIPIGAAGGGGLGLLLVVVLAVVFGGDVLGGGGEEALDPASDPDRRLTEFVGFVADDVQTEWSRAFSESGREYRGAPVVLFDRSTQSGCGAASSATGPFYCPADGKIYLDLDFFRELERRFGAPGDFAQAYVIAHEYAHHVQSLTGISEDVRRSQQEDPSQANELSIRLELQADCLAGVWGSSAAEADILEPGDLEEGLTAAAAIGDDRIQEQATGRIDRESWTHGSSEQRVTWFRRGFESGDVQACNTFGEDVVLD